jgi:hypothetical protein
MPSAPQFSPRLRDIKATSFAAIERYWNDPAYRQQCDNEARHAHELSMSAMDRRMIANDTRFPCNWTPQEKLDAKAKIEGKAT